MNRWLNFLVLIAAFFTVLGCQKDDICPEGSNITPLLVIQFIDEENPENLAAIENLTVIAVGKEDTLLGPETVNEVAIPLRTDTTRTQYRFIIEPAGEEPIEDTVSFFYSPNIEYLNRACGFKVNYSNLNVDLEEDGQEWIQDIIILETLVENDTTAHISFVH